MGQEAVCEPCAGRGEVLARGVTVDYRGAVIYTAWFGGTIGLTAPSIRTWLRCPSCLGTGRLWEGLG